MASSLLSKLLRYLAAPYDVASYVQDLLLPFPDISFIVVLG